LIHFALLDFELPARFFFAPAPSGSFVTTSAARPPVEVALMVIRAAVAMHAGHIASLLISLPQTVTSMSSASSGNIQVAPVASGDFLLMPDTSTTFEEAAIDILPEEIYRAAR
jgi:hypothetical protein